MRKIRSRLFVEQGVADVADWHFTIAATAIHRLGQAFWTMYFTAMFAVNLCRVDKGDCEGGATNIQIIRARPALEYILNAQVSAKTCSRVHFMCSSIGHVATAFVNVVYRPELYETIAQFFKYIN